MNLNSNALTFMGKATNYNIHKIFTVLREVFNIGSRCEQLTICDNSGARGKGGGRSHTLTNTRVMQT